METIATSPPPLAFTPADVAAASADWGCNCGPAALAAALGWTLDAVKPLMSIDFKGRGYMDSADMLAAARRAGATAYLASRRWPRHGVVRVQFGGPWMRSARYGWRFRHTHWIAARSVEGNVWVYDVNAPGWLALAEWEADVMPRIAASIERCDGTYGTEGGVYEIRKGQD